MKRAESNPQPLKLTARSTTPADTQGIARIIGSHATPPLAIALAGPVGAGKTTFVKGLAAGMGIPPEEVCSPSFVIVREYEGTRYRLYHADFYRLEKTAFIADLGLEEYINAEGVLVMEWPRSAAELLGRDCLRVDIAFLRSNKRRITISGQGGAVMSLLRKIGSDMERRYDVSVKH